MKCSYCGASNEADAVFCEECGRSFARECPSCGTSCSPSAKFCRKCRTPLISDAATKTIERAPSSYTPKHLAEKILTSRVALEGERKQVTVLFADVKGSMDLAEQIDPEEWHKIMDRFFAILGEGVHRFEGTINQYTGDGIMALFGAPIAHEDHAQRACYAALQLQEELRGYAESCSGRGARAFRCAWASTRERSWSARSATTCGWTTPRKATPSGLAARMEQLASPGSAYLTEHTAKLVSRLFAAPRSRIVRDQGVREPLHVLELAGMGRMRTRLDVSRARGLLQASSAAQSEMAVLEAALERAIAGNAQVVGVVAEAGTGKSRLCHEFAERCRAREIRVYEGHGSPTVRPYRFFRCSSSSATTSGSPRATRRARRATRSPGACCCSTTSSPRIFRSCSIFSACRDPERPAPPLDPDAREATALRLAAPPRPRPERRESPP